MLNEHRSGTYLAAREDGSRPLARRDLAGDTPESVS